MSESEATIITAHRLGLSEPEAFKIHIDSKFLGIHTLAYMLNSLSRCKRSQWLPSAGKHGISEESLYRYDTVQRSRCERDGNDRW